MSSYLILVRPFRLLAPNTFFQYKNIYNVLSIRSFRQFNQTTEYVISVPFYIKKLFLFACFQSF
jgi:hypothetical protein